MRRMEPQIRYVKTEDGASIAYWVAGNAGPVLVHGPPGPVGHIAAEMRVRTMRTWYERLMQSFRLVRYDPRGVGSSDRSRHDATQEANVRDLRAVVATQGPEAVAIFAGLQWSLSAIEVAARWPAMVSHLILWNPIARREDHQPTSRLLATRELVTKDWRAYTDAWAQAGFGWTRAEDGREWSRWLNEATTPEHTLERIKAYGDFDVSDLLPQVRCPVLVVGHSFGTFSADPEAPKRIASEIPNAQLTVLEGRQIQPPMVPEQADRHAELIERFLGITAPSSGRFESAHSAGTSIIMFADIVDSTALTERMGDAAFRERARVLDDALRAAISGAGGTAIEGKLLGDSVLATFPAASQAIDAALRCAVVGNDGGLPLHLGIHAGDVIREANNVYGGAVNIASRISALSAPGEVLVSDIVRGLARTSAGVVFEDRGEHALKGVADPQRVFVVHPSEAP
jgi:class 3 adenylate cyclase/pimeloyl-ACP methyl ester carboxylesterase